MVKKNKSDSSNQIKNQCLKRLKRKILSNQANDSYIIEKNNSKLSKDQKSNDDLPNNTVQDQDFKENNQNQQLDINNDKMIQQQQKYRHFQQNCRKKIYTYFSKCSKYVNNLIFILKEACLSFYYSFTNQRVLNHKKDLQKQNQLQQDEEEVEQEIIKQEKIEQEEENEDKQELEEENKDNHFDDRTVEEQSLDKCKEYRILNSKKIKLFKILSEEGFSNFEMLNDSLEVSLLRAYQNSLNCNVIIQAYHSNIRNDIILKYKDYLQTSLKILKVIQNKDDTINYIVFENYKQTLVEQIDIYGKANKSFSNQDIQKIIVSIFQYFKTLNKKLNFEIENIVQLENDNYVIFDQDYILKINLNYGKNFNLIANRMIFFRLEYYYLLCMAIRQKSQLNNKSIRIVLNLNIVLQRTKNTEIYQPFSKNMYLMEDNNSLK